MKIKRIESIKNYGIFTNYTSVDVKDFGKNNIIFGWNYSGKTTLSRIFRSLEKKEHHVDFKKGKFKLIDDEGNIITESDIPTNSLRLRVFNTDYIKENIELEDVEEGMAPILILGEENIKLRREIERLTKDKLEKETIRKGMEKEIESKNDALGKLETKEARFITNELGLGRNFTKATLENFLKDDNIHSWYINDEEFKRLKTIAQSSNKLDPIKEIHLNIDTSLITNTRSILAKTVTPAKIIERLKKNPDLESWVREGISLHKGEERCGFCGGELHKDLLNELDLHFSKEYETFRGEVEKHLVLLGKKKLKPDLKTKNDFYPDLQEEYGKNCDGLKSEITKYNDIINKLEELTKRKMTELMREIIPDKELISNIEALKILIGKFNELIKLNNSKSDKFNQIKAEALESLKLHYISQFYKDNNICMEKMKLKKLGNELDKVLKEINKLNNEIAAKDSKVSELDIGARSLNNFIKRYFGNRTEMEIKVDNHRFYLYRGNKVANNLSEGEKTAISFSYFLTRLSDKDTKNELSNTIVYIDDPISSLDNNHIFYTHALIMNNLKNKCGQLFISTHNYNFFNMLKDDFQGYNVKHCNFENRKNNECKSWLFQVDRSRTNACIKNLDCLICKYKSEYQYIFYQIYEFYNKEDLDNEFKSYIMPNLLRRFLETYLGFNYPANAHLGGKLGNLIINSDEKEFVYKIINELSHSENIERAFKMYTTDEIRHAIKIVFDSFNKTSSGKEYLDELKKSVGID